MSFFEKKSNFRVFSCSHFLGQVGSGQIFINEDGRVVRARNPRLLGLKFFTTGK